MAQRKPARTAADLKIELAGVEARLRDIEQEILWAGKTILPRAYMMLRHEHEALCDQRASLRNKVRAAERKQRMKSGG